MTSFIKQFDEFGQPITMTYNGSNRYNTCFGAILTIFGKVVILGVVIWGIINLVT